MSTRARDLADILDNTLALARVRARNLDRDLASVLASDLVDEVASANDLASYIVRARASASTLDSHLVRASAGDFTSYITRARTSTLVLARDLDSARDLSRELVSDLDSASYLARDLVRASGHLEREVRRVALQAARLLAVVARLLPAADRARYDEEFRSELQDLAQAGAGRLRQVAYALRQLRCARLTVSALRSPRRRGVTP